MPTYIDDVIGIFKKIHAYIQQAKKNTYLIDSRGLIG
jgi:hypothetical protein